MFLESSSYEDEDIVADICRKYMIRNWSINSDGLVDVDGNVYIHGFGLTNFPINFGKVSGDFSCSGNKLTSLEGCPKKVGGDFVCHHNNLTSLEGLVKAGYFNANINPITNLTTIGRTMITKSISFPEAVLIHIKEIPEDELLLIMGTMKPQFILDLNDFRIFNFLRTNFPQKYDEVMKLRNIDLESDLGELGF